MLFKFPFRAMGSGCEVLIRGQDQRQAQAWVTTALQGVGRLEAKYSFFLPESLLARINREAYHQPVALDDETLRLLEEADRLHRDTGGAFDPTIGGLKGLWNFSAMALPPDQEISRALEGVGWDKVEWEKGALRFLHPDTRLDFGGLVKEYAVDVCVAALETLGTGNGLEAGLVNLGGDLRVVGRIAPDGRPWNVGVADPRRHGSSLATISLYQGAVVTSGDYMRYFLRDGLRYHHLLNPRTGRPFPLEFSSVTAHGATALEASGRVTRVLYGGRGALPAIPPTQPPPPEFSGLPATRPDLVLRAPPGSHALFAYDNQGAPAFLQDEETCAYRAHPQGGWQVS
ncbi:MAG: FAD:protein FMN transferase [Deltaproteobacteria bacterium]|nr:FAD:protein FMN transferase [Deltaproteobacteria bacterium]